MSNYRAISTAGGIAIEGPDEDEAYDRERQREVDAENQAAHDVKSADWWEERLGSLDLGKDSAQALARAMANLDGACTGCPISRDAVLTALSIFQRAAKADALDLARHA